MNSVKLKGIITNIQPSHTIQGMEFNKANLIVKRSDGKEDFLNIRFKKFSNPYSDNQEVTLSGNLRSYSTRLEDGKNKVELYVFTYFDQPELNENDQEYINHLEIDGRICKIEKLRETRNGKHNIHMILANNLIVSEGSKKLNSACIFILLIIDASFKITPEPTKPFKETLWLRPLKLLSAIPTDPKTPVTESRPPPTEMLAVLCS